MFNQIPTFGFGKPRWVFSRKFTEFRLMGVMAMGAEQVKFLTIPLAYSPAVNSYFPVAINRTVTLTAKPVGFLKRDILPGD